MEAKIEVKEAIRDFAGNTERERLLAGLPVLERQLRLAGISTAVLEGGSGPPMVLLHGPGEFALKWLRVIPDLVRTHRVIAPDLPGHGNTGEAKTPFDAGQVFDWLGELIEQTCPSPPVLVGHVLGGSIAARFAADHSERLDRLVLIDTLGLGSFRPSLKFAASMLGFLVRPNPRSYDRFMRQCSYDLDGLREEMGDRWEPFESYNIDLARRRGAKTGSYLMRKLGVPRIPPEVLARNSVPTVLIWGRHDRANRVRIPEAASARYGWPLYVIENCADDPPRDRPEAFLEVLYGVLQTQSHKPERSKVEEEI